MSFYNITHNINPTLLNIGSFEIRYYGLFYIIGFIIAYFLLNYLVKVKHIKLTKDDILDYLLYLGLGMIIGSRLFYFIFYNPSIILNDPLSILKIWQGGMSFHGGFIGAVFFGYIFSVKKKIKFYKLADITIIPLTLALALGRIGNFINGELYGRMYEGIFCIDYSKSSYVNNVEGCRFPSQIFESIKNILIFIPLFYLATKKKLKDGIIFWLFVIFYGALRFLIEFIRQPDEQIGYILNYFTMGQILCIIMIIIGFVMLYKINKQK